ncbi:MAG: hypothetical protein ACJ8C4_21075 [Gemmataceae bacterium]
MPNYQAHQPMGMGQLHIWKSARAPPVRCSTWLGVPLLPERLGLGDEADRTLVDAAADPPHHPPRLKPEDRSPTLRDTAAVIRGRQPERCQPTLADVRLLFYRERLDL